jgi:hypothetical protein
LLGGPVLRHAYNEATQLLEVWAADTGTVTLVCSRAQSDGPAESAAVKVAAGE